MQIFHPEKDLNLSPRRSSKFRVFYMWGIEICNTKHNHLVWLANLLKINYASVGIKFPMKFKYTKFFYGSQHRNLKIGFIYVKWGFYTRIHKNYKYTKNGKSKKNTRSKKGI